MSTEMDDRIEDSDIEVSYLACIDGHGREAEILRTLQAVTAELDRLVDGDLFLLARLFGAMTASLYSEAQKTGTEPDEAPEISAAMLIDAMTAHSDPSDTEPDAEADIREAAPTPWSVSNDMRYSKEGRRLHLLQFGDDVAGSGAITYEDLPLDLEKTAETLNGIEAGYLRAAREASLEVRSVSPAREVGEETNYEDENIFYADRHLYHGYLWRGHVRGFLGDCVRRCDISSIDRLDEICRRLPTHLAAIVVDEMRGVAEDVRSLAAATSGAVAEGMPVQDFRDMVAERDFSRFPMVKVNPWLGDLCRDGHLVKGTKGSRVAYWPGPAGWPFPS